MIARATVATLVAMTCLSLASTARADTPPDVWSRARDPEKKSSFALHREVVRLLSQESSVFNQLGEANRLRARDLLERANVAEGKDVVLKFDLGAVYERLDLHEQAVRVLESALGEAPDHPAAEDAWFKLAIAYAKLDRPADERHAYVEYLARSTHPLSRSTALLNFAETEMRMGHLGEAIARYREALDFSKQFVPRSNDTYVLALWGLAVALDRYGDATAAAVKAEEAARLDAFDRLIANPDQVFFVPSYERSWYLGLGAAARARLATDPRMSLVFAQRAEAHFADYVARATARDRTAPVKDRWRPLAEKRLAVAKAERKRIEVKVRTLPKLTLDTEGL